MAINLVIDDICRFIFDNSAVMEASAEDLLEIPPLEEIPGHILASIPKHVQPGSKAFREIVFFGLQNEGLGPRKPEEPLNAKDDTASEGGVGHFSSSEVHNLVATLPMHEFQPELLTAIIRQFASAIASVTTRDFVNKCQYESLETLKQQLKDGYAYQARLAVKLDSDDRKLRVADQTQQTIISSLQAEKATSDALGREYEETILRQRVEIDSLRSQVDALTKQSGKPTERSQYDRASQQIPENQERPTNSLEIQLGNSHPTDLSISQLVQMGNTDCLNSDEGIFSPLVEALDQDIRLWSNNIKDSLDDWDAGKLAVVRAGLQFILEDMEKKRLLIHENQNH
ncbi:hypothetical protein GALMADRAFT_249673 [Galerina marginata CBS 339.88]|uniref:Uncharacterized protein n=1 Tax=Galerina marginata (strain CBS 339.88) TaxID=685588 RepID=A0A067SXJ0_GALM3|nr:hypothetical protein GALMADRAFT_249673 [Galerina marginata CBS 339.88]